MSETLHNINNQDDRKWHFPVQNFKIIASQVLIQPILEMFSI